MLTLKVCWKEGREERCTETELTTYNPEQIRELLKKAVKYSGEPIPEGLLQEGETL